MSVETQWMAFAGLRGYVSCRVSLGMLVILTHLVTVSNTGTANEVDDSLKEITTLQ